MSTKLVTYPLQSNAITYGASTMWYQQQDEIPAGVIGQLDFLVVQKAGGATMSVDVSIGANGVAVAYVPYLSPAGGLRRVQLSAASNSGIPGSVNTDDWIATFTAADATNPRIDSVYLVLQDSTLDATGNQRGMLQVVAGTATAGATLDNRTNAGAAPANSLLLADVLISATQTTVTTAKIRDRRQIGPNANPVAFPTSGGNPAGVDMVTFVPSPGMQTTTGQILGVTAAQAAAAMYLPRRIVNATRVRWSYIQPVTTADTGNWIIAICDSSGRPIQATASTAFTGAADSSQSISAAITAQTFEAGTYWIFFGHTDVGGVSPHTVGVTHKGGTGRIPIGGPNQMAYLSAGGITVPATILGMTDAYATPSANVQYGVPIISLSVG